jgi:hypothetical protein
MEAFGPREQVFARLAAVPPPAGRNAGSAS